jgi:hypothetical protein
MVLVQKFGYKSSKTVNVSNDFGRALDSGKEIRVVFCDSKAFDRVWHKGLLFKLKQYGISGNLLVWFERYLSGRSQRVVLNGSNSEWKTMELNSFPLSKAPLKSFEIFTN